MLLVKKRPKICNMNKFAKLITKNSYTQVIIIKNEMELCNFLEKT